ncbi:phosphoinositide phosphatase SAC2-like [Chenopodium quinoa]|uniref:phosphoinositide phosphatase SAC2-like n=1 Tax=Chenopodium quinoa TaxID=63459 RepID=UPI000B789F92|nr:phosphoinositide phosphatase SAC2-like [Chenopodium quinoa]
MVGSERGEEEVNYRFRRLEEMGSENQNIVNGLNQIVLEQGESSNSSPPYYLEKFTLYETSTDFYMVGRDAKREHWRVLKIDRSKPCELVFCEDPKIYSYEACKRLLATIIGLKCITDYYGIVGFIKFVKSYHIILITERKEVGKIWGHPIYSITKYRMISISQSTALTYMYNSSKENRYKKLLQLVDIRDNFFFSYSYPLMHRVQHNLNSQEMRFSYDNMFVWNEYLSYQIRESIKSTIWTVALIHGFFKQVELCTSGKNFILTLIARRSCQFAGTRYEKRGVNEKGQAANDVEVEQTVWPIINSKRPTEITSIVQNRASIPLCWSQKPSLFNLKPDILLSEGNHVYDATQLHFKNMRLRYGVPIIILNLIKSSKETHREYLLHKKFEEAVNFVNAELDVEDRVDFVSLDLDAAFRDEKTDELKKLQGLVENALSKTGIFSYQMAQNVNNKSSLDSSYVGINSSDSNNICNNQKGIIRVNCLDSLDRTNFAQYVYGLVSLGHQLHTLGIIESQVINIEDPLACDLMSLYQAMGDALSRQYGGSPAHHKIFSKIRGQYKMASQFQEFMKSIQRHCSNSFTDGAKQHAIDLFLGHYKPEFEGGELIPCETNSDQIDKCGWMNYTYLHNISRCNPCIYSDFDRLLFESNADEAGHQCLTGPPGSPQHESQEGYV